MKYLKHFNEELKPETYITAGNSLKYYGKHTKGNKLVDYGYEKGHGFYNAHIQYVGLSPVYTGKITNPICKFYYGTPQWDGPHTGNSKLVHTDLSEEQLVSDWKNGNGPLSFTLEFRFTPSEELKSELKKLSDDDKLKFAINHWHSFHLFTMNVSLSGWNEGLKYYNYIEDDDEFIEPGDPNYIDLIDLYQNTKSLSIRLSRLMDKGIYGIFADRQSALKFKRNLPSLINPHKEKIMNLLSIIGGGAEELEDIFESFDIIRINSLYQSEDIKGVNLHNTWYKGFL